MTIILSWPVEILLMALIAAAFGSTFLPVQSINILVGLIAFENVITLHFTADYERKHPALLEPPARDDIASRAAVVTSWRAEGRPGVVSSMMMGGGGHVQPTQPLDIVNTVQVAQPTMASAVNRTTCCTATAFYVHFAFAFTVTAYVTLVIFSDGFALHPALSFISVALVALEAGVMALVNARLVQRGHACFQLFNAARLEGATDAVAAIRDLKAAIDGIALLSKELSRVLVPRFVLLAGTAALALFTVYTDPIFSFPRFGMFVLCVASLAAHLTACSLLTNKAQTTSKEFKWSAFKGGNVHVTNQLVQLLLLDPSKVGVELWGVMLSLGLMTTIFSLVASALPVLYNVVSARLGAPAVST